MREVVFFVPGTVVPKARPRMNRKTGAVYTPKGTAHFEGIVRSIAAVHFPEPFTGPVGVEMTFALPRPKRLIWKRKRMVPVWHTTRPDLDNLEKTIMDALNGIAWNDDAQVCRKFAEKYIVSGDGTVGVHVLVRELEPWEYVAGKEGTSEW